MSPRFTSKKQVKHLMRHIRVAIDFQCLEVQIEE